MQFTKYFFSTFFTLVFVACRAFDSDTLEQFSNKGVSISFYDKENILKNGKWRILPAPEKNQLRSEFYFKGYSDAEYFVVVKNPLLSTVAFYQYSLKDSLLRYSATGSRFPYAFREADNRYFVFKTKAEPDSSYRIMLVSETPFAKSAYVQLFTKEDLEKWYETDTLVLSAFLAFLFITAILSVLLYFVYNEAIFLKLLAVAIPLFFLELYEYGFLKKFVYPDFSTDFVIHKNFFFSLVCSGMLFVVPEMVFPLPVLSKRMKSFCTWAGFGGIVVASLLYMCVERNIYFHIADTLFKLFATVAAATLVYSLIISFKIRPYHRSALYFIASLLPFLVLSPLSLLFNNGFNGWAYFYELSTFFQITFFVLALIYRSRYLMSERFATEIAALHERFSSLGNGAEKEKYKNSKFSSDDVEAGHTLLLNLMNNNKPYLDTEINLAKLSALSGIHSHLLSQIINQKEEKNFFDFINHYRVQDARQMLTDKAFDNRSVEGIGYECGFNSKATFYTTFKKSTGHTPAEYKKIHTQQPK